MRRRGLGWVLWVACGLLAAACGGSEQSDPSGNTGGNAGADATGGSSVSADPVPIEDLCPLFTHDLCVYLMQCQTARYRELEHCERELDCFGMTELLASAESGAVDYDPSAVGQCHARFSESPCTFGFFLFTPDIYEVLAFCPGTLTPRLQAGDACLSNGECSAGLYCDKGADYQCPGECRVFAQDGEACPDSVRCASGLECNAGICEPEQTAGDPCDFSCEYSVVCPEGEVCNTNIWCDRELGQCQLARLEGEPCGAVGSGDTASTANCAVHLWCDAIGAGSGVCRAPSALGGPCNDESYSCEDGTHCTGYVPSGAGATLGTCAGPSAVGADCSRDADCQAELVCIDLTCAEPGAAGATCYENSDCQQGLLCRNLVCVDAPYPGEPCDANGGDAMECAFSRCVNGTCEYHAKVGEVCASGEDCATGECVDSLCYDDSVCNAPE